MATEKWLIDASELHSVLEEIEQSYLESNTMSGNFAAEVIKMVQRILAQVPTVDAVEVVHGHWIPIPEHENKRCSVCRIVFPDFTLGYYCPYCGAKMDGERKET